MKINEIYNMDCLKGMQQLYLENGPIIDAIICDPPYNISKDNRLNTMGRKGIDFGEWDKNFDLISWIEPSLKLLKKGGNIVIFNDWKNLGDISKELERLDCLTKGIIIWEKTNPMPRNRDRLFISSCEYAIWGTKGKGWTFNRGNKPYNNGIYKYPIVHGKKRKHPTQKPKELISDIIKTLTNEGDVILDPFSGSGTFAFSAIDTNRQFIGFELDEKYYNQSQNDLNEYKNSMII